MEGTALCEGGSWECREGIVGVKLGIYLYSFMIGRLES